MAKDVAFQLLPSNFMQTAVNAATQLTAAAITSGFVTDVEEAEVFFDSQADRIFERLLEQVVLDNEKLKADFDAAPEKSYAKGGNKKQDNVAPADRKFTWGKNSGKTIAQVYADDQSYIDWLLNKDTNPARNDMRESARQYVDGLKAGV